MMQFRLHRTALALILFAGLPVIAPPYALYAQEPDEDEFTQTSDQRKDIAAEGDPVALFYEAQKAHEKGDLDEALRLYSLALEVLPEFPEAEYQSAMIYASRGEIEKAESALRRAVEHRRDWTLALSALGALLVRKGSFVEAETHLDKAIRIDPMSYPAYTALTELYLQTSASEGKFRELLARLQYLATKSKIPASVWVSKASVERVLGELAAARASLNRALETDPKDGAALAEQTELLLLEKDYEGAVNSARALVAADPDSSAAKSILARALHSANRSGEAVKVLESISEPDPEVSVLLSRIRASSEESIALLEAALEADREDPAILGRLCVIARIPAPAKSLDYCRRALELEPANLDHAVGVGAALLQLRRYEESTAVFTQLLRIAPENHTVRANLATALFQLGRFEDAKAEYLWITNREPDLAIAYYFLAISYDRLSQYRDALANYQRFIELADDETFELEIDKVKLRLPALERLVKDGKGKK